MSHRSGTAHIKYHSVHNAKRPFPVLYIGALEILIFEHPSSTDSSFGTGFGVANPNPESVTPRALSGRRASDPITPETFTERRIRESRELLERLSKPRVVHGNGRANPMRDGNDRHDP